MPKKVSEVLGCLGCPFQKLFPNNHFVSPQMPDPKKDLVRLVCAEAPGHEENIVGVPLVGGSGRILNKLLERVKIPRDGLTIINTINCQPPKNLYPTDPAARSYISKEEGLKVVKHCIKHHVLPLLESRQWKRVDLLGSHALRYIGLKPDGVMQWRGSPITIDTEAIRREVEV